MAGKKRSFKKRTTSIKIFPKVQFILSLFLVILGVGLISFASAEKITWITKTPLVASQKVEKPSEKPIKIYIPKIKRTLNISDGYISGDRWAISDTGVSFLTTSALPGKMGNSVIYGHNTQGILGGLWRVSTGDNIYIVLANGEFVKYQVAETKEIKPSQVEILNNSEDSRLTLYTCSGFLDTARFVVVAQKV